MKSCPTLLLLWLALLAPAGAEEPRRFVVVAPSSFHAELSGYLAHKQKQLPTRLVSLEEILASAEGVDHPEKLKRWLYDEWKERRLGYALLVGDADVFPVRYMVLDRITEPAFHYAFYPSDLYYSDLAKQDGRFEDWNARKDSFHARYFGEVRGEHNKSDPINFDEIDYRPEIAVGRWPVSTPAEVRLVADKTIRYEQGLEAPDRPGLRRAAWISVGGWIDTRPGLDRLSRRMPAGWTVEKRYYHDARRKEGIPPSEEAIHRLLNEGVSLMCHTGHGQDDCWEQCFFQKNLGALQNQDRLPVIVSIGCSTARFATLPPYEPYVDVDGKEHPGTNNKQVFQEPPPPPAVYQKGRYNPPGLGEQLLRGGPHGAVAYIGCNTGSQPCGWSLLEGLIFALEKSPEPRLGDCWAEAVRYYYSAQRLESLKPNRDWYPPSIFFQGMKFMLFGDPTLQLPKPAAAEASGTARAGQ